MTLWGTPALQILVLIRLEGASPHSSDMYAYCDFFMFLDSMPRVQPKPVDQFSWIIAQNTQILVRKCPIITCFSPRWRFMGHFFEKPQFPSQFALICIGTLQWKEYDPICMIHLWNCSISLIFQTIFKRITPVNLELKEYNFWRKKSFWISRDTFLGARKTWHFCDVLVPPKKR
jgi:hypothetical protein